MLQGGKENQSYAQLYDATIFSLKRYLLKQPL